MRSIDLNLFRVFDALMRHRSVTRAAADLGLTQSSVSNALARLRGAVGDRLLERQGNAMAPTRVAEELWPAVREALSRLDQGVRALEGFEPREATGRFRVAMGDYAMALLAAEVAARVARDAPGVTLELVAAVPGTAEDELSTGRTDLVVGAVWGDIGRLAATPMFDEHFVGLCARSHPFAHGPVSIEQFCGVPHVLSSARGLMRGNVDAGLQRRGRDRHVAVTVPGFDEAARIVARGDSVVSCGARLADQLAARYDLARFELPLDVPGFSVRALCRPENSHTPSIVWLTRTLRAAVPDR